MHTQRQAFQAAKLSRRQARGRAALRRARRPDRDRRARRRRTAGPPAASAHRRPAPVHGTRSSSRQGDRAVQTRPQGVAEVITAANHIAQQRYVLRRRPRQLQASGYDCSGSVSYALHGGALLRTPSTRAASCAGLSAARAAGSPSTRTRPRVHGGRRAAIRHLDDGGNGPGWSKTSTPSAWSDFRKRHKAQLLAARSGAGEATPSTTREAQRSELELTATPEYPSIDEPSKRAASRPACLRSTSAMEDAEVCPPEDYRPSGSSYSFTTRRGALCASFEWRKPQPSPLTTGGTSGPRTPTRALAGRCGRRTSARAACARPTATSSRSPGSTSRSPAGEFFTLLGPSGSGQDDDPADDRRLRAARRGHGRARRPRRRPGSPPYDREVNTVFQDYALFPHMTVGENVEYGLRVRKVAQGRARARAATRRSRWSAWRATRRRKPGELSGGQRQRVALARAIVNRPRVLLLDEPLGALDLKLREQMQVELKGIQGEVGITFIYVTHDQDEALTMSDRIAVFNEGRIEQVGTPAEVYERPATHFVTGFVGVSNVLERDGRGSRSGPRRSGCSRPASDAHGLHTERGVIRDVAYAGMVTRYLVELDAGGELQVVRQNLETSSAEALEQRGREVTVGWRPEQTVAVPEDQQDTKGGPPVRGQASWSSGEVAWMIAAGLIAFMVAFAAGCGSSTASSSRNTDMAADGRQGRGRAQPGHLGRLRRQPQWQVRLREADRLPGQRQGGRHLRRDGPADADRPVRRRLGVGQRDARASSTAATSPRSTSTWSRTTRRSSPTSRTSRTTRSTASTTGSRTAAGRTC